MKCGARAKVEDGDAMTAARKSAWLLVLGMVAATCAGSRAVDPTPGEFRKVEIASVGLDRESGAHFVLLADKQARRGLPILIGDTEARAIMLELHGIRSERPLTNDLLRNVIEETGNHVDRVVIGDLRDQTYYATIYLDPGRHHVDSRPSDAIALALSVNAPIFVSAKLFQSDAGGIDLGEDAGLPGTSRGLGMVVQEITKDLAVALAEQPHSGVLVSEAKGAAASAGVQRGDILIAVGGTPVKTLKDFDQGVAGLKPGDSIALTLKRAGAAQAVTIKVPAQTGQDG